MRKINVLQVNKMYYPVTGGVEKVVQQISEGINELEDIEIEVLACEKKGLGITELINNIKIYKASSLGIFFSMPLSITFPFLFSKLIKEKDIVHIHLPNPLSDLSLKLSNYRGKVVVSWHADIVKQKKILKLIRPLITSTLKRADMIIVATEGHIEGSEFLKPFKDKCVVIPFGIEKENIPMQPSFQNNQVKRILFVGRLVTYKGIDILLKSLQDIDNFKLYIIGTGIEENNLIDLCNELNLQEKVVFLGAVDDYQLKEQYEKADIFILPSITKAEAFGLVQIEAMSYGIPIINTQLNSGVPFVSIDGETGITVEPGNIKELNSAIKKLIKDDELRISYGENAYKRVKKYFILEERNNEIYQNYKRLLRRNSNE